MSTAEAESMPLAPYSKEVRLKKMCAIWKKVKGQPALDTNTSGVPEMKSEGKSETKKGAKKKMASCPFFTRFYLGVCTGHTFPYAPSLDEKKQYCLTAYFQSCLIYEHYVSTDGHREE
jgi:hypothetical protein